MSDSAMSNFDSPYKYCGIDVGGTKIGAKLFDENLNPIGTKLVMTPKSSYEDFLAVLTDIVQWVGNDGSDREIPIGIGIPGLIDQETGVFLTANLPATGKKLAMDLTQIGGGRIFVENDCKCFVLSESNGTKGNNERLVGLTIGTGLGSAICENGKLVSGYNGSAGEVGHVSLPANIISEFDLPVLQCGCGRTGCYETILSGKGFQNLDEILNGSNRTGEELTDAVQENDLGAKKVLEIWQRVLGELLHTFQLVHDPDCIVLGGGVANLKWVIDGAKMFLSKSALTNLRLPEIREAEFGNWSGTRGAALLAKQNSTVD